MIDFIKLSLRSPTFAQSLSTNIHLIKTGEYKNFRTDTFKEIYTYRGLTFKVYITGRVEIEGSLHKFFNGGHHNHNDFSYESLIRTIQELSNTIGEELLNAEVNNLEYGLNLNPSFPAMEYIDSLIVYHSKGIRDKSPITRNDCKGFEKGVRFTLSQYEIKIYNKSQQYSEAKANTLRIEFKTRKMEIIDSIGIGVLRDLLDKTKITCLHSKLSSLFPNCISNEAVNMSGLSAEKIQELQEAINPLFWGSIKNPYIVRARMKSFLNLQEQHGLTNRKQELIRLIDEKFKELI